MEPLLRMMSFNSRSLNIGFVLVFILCTEVITAQDIKRDKMEQLSFLVGEWVGTTKVIENGLVTKKGAAYEKISYDLDRSILVIELNTEFLQLRTIVTYQEKDQKYYYHRFSKDGTAIYPAEFTDGQLIVWRDADTRFFFGSTPDGGFREYGEKRIDGEWVRFFEDTFTNTQ